MERRRRRQLSIDELRNWGARKDALKDGSEGMFAAFVEKDRV